jgi:hypothetical protein
VNAVRAATGSPSHPVATSTEEGGVAVAADVGSSGDPLAANLAAVADLDLLGDPRAADSVAARAQTTATGMSGPGDGPGASESPPCPPPRSPCGSRPATGLARAAGGQ